MRARSLAVTFLMVVALTAPNKAQAAVDFGLSTVALAGMQVSGNCGMNQSGDVYCWQGEVPNSPRQPETIPSLIRLPMAAVAIKTGGGYHCAILRNTSLFCWSDFNFKDPSFLEGAHRAVPFNLGELTGVSDISLADAFGCAVLLTGDMDCWGDNTFGQIGNIHQQQSSTVPVAMHSFSNIKKVVTARNMACAIDADGNAFCWGSGDLGGGPNTSNSYDPVQISGISFRDIATDGMETCGVSSSDELYCWGYFIGADSQPTILKTPEKLPIPESIEKVIVNGGGYALTTSGQLLCWGLKSDGCTLQPSYVPAIDKVQDIQGWPGSPAFYRGGSFFRLNQFSNFPTAVATPTDLGVVDVDKSQNSLKLTLHTYLGQGQASGFSVAYRSVVTSEWTDLSSNNILGNQVTLNNLTPATGYFIRFQAKDSATTKNFCQIKVFTTGLSSNSIQIVDANGTPFQAGQIKWETFDGTAMSSKDIPLTALGTATLLAVPGTEIGIQLKNLTSTDGFHYNGGVSIDPAAGMQIVSLPAAPTTTNVSAIVTLTSGEKVPNAKIDLANLRLISPTFYSDFLAAEDDSFLGSKYPNRAFSGEATAPKSSYVTDSNGAVNIVGWATGTVSGSATYDDGVLFQRSLQSDAVNGILNLQLGYLPTIQVSNSQVTAPLNALVTVPVSISSGVSPSSNMLSTSSFLAQGSRLGSTQPSGLKVSIVPPVGANVSSCGKTVTSAKTNAKGKAVLKICASVSGAYRLVTRGAVSINTLNLHVKGSKPMAPQSYASLSHGGSVTVAWAKPEYDGGASIKSYILVASSPGLKSETRTVKPSATNSVTFGNLQHGRFWAFKLIAKNKYGASPEVSTKTYVQ